MQIVKNTSFDDAPKNYYLKELRTFEIALKYAPLYRRAYFRREIARFKSIISHL